MGFIYSHLDWGRFIYENVLLGDKDGSEMGETLARVMNGSQVAMATLDGWNSMLF